MANKDERLQIQEVYKEALGDFQEIASNVYLNRMSPSDICHGRNAVVLGWALFAEAMEAYCYSINKPGTFKNSGLEETVELLTSDHEPDRLLSTNAHYLFQKYTFNDLDNPGEFLSGLEPHVSEHAMAFCVQIYDVGFKKNDLDIIWPILPLDKELWSVMTQQDKDFMKTFTIFEASWGGVPLSAIDNFPRTRLLKSEKQFRFLLDRMLNIGLVTQKPLEEESIYVGSKDNLDFLGLK